jgi:hypothetical protein
MGRTACTEPQCLYKGALCFTFAWYPPKLEIVSSIRSNKTRRGLRQGTEPRWNKQKIIKSTQTN